MTPGQLDQLLLETDDVPPLSTLVDRLVGPVAEEIARCAAGPLAPLMCHALTREPAERDHVTALLSGLAVQRSSLALLDATDDLLGSGAFIESYGRELHRSFLAGASGAQPLVAAAFAEGAVRLAIAGSGDVMRTAVLLTPENVADLDPDYAERLPRLVGAALDMWGAEPSLGESLRHTLYELRQLPSSSASAAFEVGLHQLRTVAADPMALLVEARKNFANAEAAEEVGGDAALYGTGIDAVMAFLRGDQVALQDAHAVLRGRLDERASGLRGSHVPMWRRPRTEAGFAWARLVMILARALDATTRTAWLDAWPMIDALLDAYALDRAVVPVPGVVDPDGFGLIVRPAIESSLRGRDTLLGPLRLAAQESDRVREMVSRLDAPPEPQADDEDLWRLLSLAPSLVAEVGLADAALLARQVDDEALHLVEGFAYNSGVRQRSLRNPVVSDLLDGLVAGLQPCPDYTGFVRQDFDVLIGELVTFLATRHDLQRTADVDYLGPVRPPPREARLQDDFADWLRRGPLAGRIDVEVPNVATGRADIKVGFGATRFFVEVKRELRDSSRAALERAYLAQAADYSGTSATLGVLLVLDLTPHPTGVPHLSECAWATRWRPAGSGVDRYLVVGLVIGNRSTPSVYSKPVRRRRP